MDERLIYLIFIVLWAAYKFYNNNQKKKAAAEKSQQSTVNKPQWTASVPQRRPESFRTMFEKALLGEEFSQPARGPEEDVETDQTRQMAPVAAEPRQEESYIALPQSETTKQNSQAEEISRQLKSHFNLKQALIYSTILNRPYQ